MLVVVYIIIFLFNQSLIYPESEPLIIGQDYSDVDFSKKIVKLDNNIAFYWNKMLDPSEIPDEYDEIVSFPFDWSTNPKYSVYGQGTFKTIINLPPNRPQMGFILYYSLDFCRVYINGKEIAQNIFFSEPNHEIIKRKSSMVIELPDEDIIEIVLQIENENDNHGGIAITPVIGDYELLLRDNSRAVIFDGFLFGALIFTGLLYFSFYLSRKNDKSALYFGIFSLVLGIRTILYGEHILLMMFPNFNLELEATLGHITFYLAIPIFINFITEAYPVKKSKLLLFTSYFVSMIFVIIAIIFPHKVLIQLLYIYQIFSIIVSLIALVILVKKAIIGNRGAIVTLSGFVLLLIAAINDILLSQEIIATAHFTPLGMVFFIMSQGILLCWSFATSFNRSEKLAAELTLANISFRRFVPEEFLNFLERSQISDIKLGDHVQLNMTIMFCDIRDFTTLSEKMSPRENFLFINSFLERIGPVIRENGGFIDKYMGDGIMSIFPNGADSAVKTALDMLKALELYNKHRANSGYNKINLGIGINTGFLMLGTIGENQRMDGTVISDAVNICSRIESITKEYGLNIAISENTYSSLNNKESFNMRNIGNIYLKGKKEPVTVYELFDMDPIQHVILKNETKEEFEKAVEFYELGNLDDALYIFNSILEKLPQDMACLNYIKRIKNPEYGRDYFDICN